MKNCILFLCFLVPFTSNAQLDNATIHHLKTGRIIDDKSYAYHLPYTTGKRYLFVQGANSSFSHKGELSFDFKMKQGTTICAARDGIVIETKEDSDKGGLKPEFLSEGNHIIIQHNDGSIAQYWHLQYNGVLVSEGDSVKAGQAIGKSGNTGYSAFPHLHFQVIDKNGKEILPRFTTHKGKKYLRPGRWYKAI